MKPLCKIGIHRRKEILVTGYHKPKGGWGKTTVIYYCKCLDCGQHFEEIEKK